MEKFTFFWSGPFSQWHPSFFKIGGITYNCAEQYMMAEKARLFRDGKNLVKIMSTSNPKDQKRYGRQVQNFNEIKWNSVARNIVYRGNYAKFTQNPELKKKLIETAGTTLVEASPYDTIWGIGLAKEDPRTKNRSEWLGTNWLGKTLTKLRNDIIKES